MRPRRVRDRDRDRKHAMIAFQLLAYGWLLAMFLVQLDMYLSRDW